MGGCTPSEVNTYCEHASAWPGRSFLRACGTFGNDSAGQLRENGEVSRKILIDSIHTDLAHIHTCVCIYLFIYLFIYFYTTHMHNACAHTHTHTHRVAHHARKTTYCLRGCTSADCKLQWRCRRRRCESSDDNVRTPPSEFRSLHRSTPVDEERKHVK
jgi:hypothetical protein